MVSTAAPSSVPEEIISAVMDDTRTFIEVARLHAINTGRPLSQTATSMLQAAAILIRLSLDYNEAGAFSEEISRSCCNLIREAVLHQAPSSL